MISRVGGVLARSLYLLGDMDKPFGFFDTLTYGWRSIIESMRLRAEFRKRAYQKALQIRKKTSRNEADEILLDNVGVGELVEERSKNSWVMMTPSVELKSRSQDNTDI